MEQECSLDNCSLTLKIAVQVARIQLPSPVLSCLQKYRVFQSLTGHNGSPHLQGSQPYEHECSLTLKIAVQMPNRADLRH
jgi:hypothetical protein